MNIKKKTAGGTIYFLFRHGPGTGVQVVAKNNECVKLGSIHKSKL